MRRWAWALVLAVTCAVWAPTLTYDWVLTWDDLALFVGNAMVREWNWPWMLRTQYYGHWMPLTWISASATYALVGYHAAAWHGVNLALHAVSAVLVFCIARRLVGSDLGAVAAALLFSVHPLRMESVAWITERKDVLMGVGFFAALLLWMQARRGWAFVAFLAACASKSPAVMLPVWLVALEWYHARRTGTALSWGPLLRRLAPFVAVSVVVSIAAFHSLHSVLASLPWSHVGLGPRLLHVAYSAVFYAMQTVWPARLSGLIEYTWVPSWDQPQYPVAVGVVVLGAVVLRLTWRRWPALTAAAVAYTVAVLPQSGLFQNGVQLVANRYSYLAGVPLVLLAGAGVTALARRWPRGAVALAGGSLAALIVTTELALPMWRDGDAMWHYAATHEPTCTQCQDMAAAAAVRQGDLAAAIRYQRQAVTVSDTTALPRWERHWNLASLLVLQGERAAAIQELRIYLAVIPAYRLTDAADLRDREHYERALVALAALEGEAR